MASSIPHDDYRSASILVILVVRPLSVALLVATSIMVFAQQQRDAVPGSNSLEAFAGRDLRKLDGPDQEIVCRVLSELTDLDVRYDGEGPYPWWLSRIDSGRTKWIVLEGYAGRDIPDVSFVRVHLFDSNWSHLSSSTFWTGYRMFISDAKLVKQPALDGDLVSIRTYDSVNEGKRERQFYAIIDDRIGLVRLEDDKKRAIHNNYRLERPTRGPLPDRTFEEWTEALHSADLAEVLEALVWLAGRHMSSTDERHDDVNEESVEDSKIFEAVRGWAVSDTLMGLQYSPNAWVREGVELVFSPDSYSSSRARIEQLIRMMIPIVALAVIAITILVLRRRKRRER